MECRLTVVQCTRCARSKYVSAGRETVSLPRRFCSGLIMASGAGLFILPIPAAGLCDGCQHRRRPQSSWLMSAPHWCLNAAA